MTGNCLKGSRGILSFDAAFDETEWGRLTKELFTHVSFLSLPISLVGVFGHTKCSLCVSFFFWLDLSGKTDIRSTSPGSKSQAVHRPYPHVFHPRLKNLVPQFSGQARLV